MIWVDDPKTWGRTKKYSHMVSDVSLAELHLFAEAIGVKRHWFHKNHYDLREEERQAAVAAGAREASAREIVKVMAKK